MYKLTKDQEIAKQAIIDFIYSDEQCFILTGAGGTGKSHTIVETMKVVSDIDDVNRLTDPSLPVPFAWAFTATTNKAKQALQSNLLTQHEVKTIHSSLSFRVFKNKLYNSRNSVADSNTIYVIDECSYIDEHLLQMILDTKPCKIIFVGDESQLTPIESKESCVFHQGYPSVTLSTPVRQSNTPDIAEYCKKLKAFIESNGTIDFPKIPSTPEIIKVNKEKFVQLTNEAFITNNESTSDHKILAGTNRVVIKHNQRLFENANNRAELKPGDIVVNNHFVNGLATDEEVVILSINDYQHPIITAKVMEVAGNFKATIVVSPNYKKDYYALIKDSKDNPLNYSNNDALLSKLGDLRPMYACTVHKSQGSTYDTVYLDLPSLGHVKDLVELARLLYVAISRASNKVYIMTK